MGGETAVTADHGWGKRRRLRREKKAFVFHHFLPRDTEKEVFVVLEADSLFVVEEVGGFLDGGAEVGDGPDACLDEGSGFGGTDTIDLLKGVHRLEGRVLFGPLSGLEVARVKEFVELLTEFVSEAREMLDVFVGVDGGGMGFQLLEDVLIGSGFEGCFLGDFSLAERFEGVDQDGGVIAGLVVASLGHCRGFEASSKSCKRVPVSIF